MMSDLQRALVEKKLEADEMLELISDIQNASGTISNAITKVAMLRSAFVLLLYNMVESTAFLAFERVHERVASEHYQSFGNQMRKIWAEFFFSSHNGSDHYTHLEGTLEQTLRLPLIDDYSKRVKLFSGNLDGKKLNDLLKKYGIGPITAEGCDQLVLVKNRRNSLSHGQETFKEAGRNFSDSDLEGLKTSTFLALDDLVARVETFLTAKSYLAAP